MCAESQTGFTRSLLANARDFNASVEHSSLDQQLLGQLYHPIALEHVMSRILILAASISVALSICLVPQTGMAGRDHHDDDRCEQRLDGAISLPADDAVHAYGPYTLEWWYWTAHLETQDGRRYGFAQIIYTAQHPLLGIPVQWADTTITDWQTGTYHFDGRQFVFGPAAEIPSGFEFQFGADHVVGGDGHDHIRSEVVDDTRSFVVDLDLSSKKPALMHDLHPNVNYYTRQRLKTKGTILVDGEPVKVSGWSWFDHQFGDQQIALATVANWNWFAVQLDDRREIFLLDALMLDGSHIYAATVNRRDCTTVRLGAGQFDITPLDAWTPPDGACSYQMGWNVSIPSEGLEFTVEPVFPEQDIWVPTLDRYWEGEATVSGAGVDGLAYVEMFGQCPY